MRSMTLTSADTPSVFLSPGALPVTPLRNPHLSSHWHTHPRVQHGTTALPQPPFSPPSSDHSSFFDVASDTHLLSPQSRYHVTQAIRSGWAGSTIKRYSGAIKHYITFCDAEGVPAHLRFPADEFVLCAFAASSIGRHTRSTPSNRLSALKAWHIAHNLEWKGSSRLRYVLNGVHNLAPSSARRPPRPPINAKMVSQLLEHLDPNSSLDVAIAACATTAFWGQCRLGELLPPSSSVLLSTSLPTRAAFKKSPRNPHAFVLHLPSTKTHRHGQDVVLVSQKPPFNPISLMCRHLQVNDIPNDTHLFSYTSGDNFVSLTKPVFLRRCNEIWHLLGYPRTTGHCFRIGGTTELLIAGIPPDVVKATGRWSSDSFLRYWRSLDDIAPQYIRYIHRLKRKRRHR
jgi:hypothetical protein